MTTRLVAGTLALALAAGPAHAHGALAGGGGFLAGVAHPFLAVEHLILLIGLGLLAGPLARSRRGRAVFGPLALGVVAGLSASLLAPVAAPAWTATAILALGLVAGLLVAWASPRVPDLALGGLSGLAGLAIALDTDLPATVGSVAAPPGVIAGIFLIVLDTAALAGLARRPPLPVALRVLGSWICAIALMLLALAVAPDRGLT